MDPLATFSNIPIITEAILQHLTGAELIKISETSPFYHDMVFGSPKNLHKIKRNICYLNTESLKDHTYFHVEILGPSDSFRYEGMSEWITVDISRLKKPFRRLDAIKNFCPKLEELKMLAIAHCEESYTDGEMFLQSPFPKLKKLTIIHAATRMSYLVIRACPSLVSLSLTNVREIETILRDLSQTSIKLKEFHLSEYSDHNFCHSKNDLTNFLESQKNNIERLQLDIWPGISALKVVFKMPKLKHLELYQLDKANRSTNWNVIEFDRNSSIRHLTTQDLRNNISFLRKLLKSVPNLKSLKVHELTPQVVKAIELVALKELKNVEADFPMRDAVNEH